MAEELKLPKSVKKTCEDMVREATKALHFAKQDLAKAKPGTPMHKYRKAIVTQMTKELANLKFSAKEFLRAYAKEDLRRATLLAMKVARLGERITLRVLEPFAAQGRSTVRGYKKATVLRKEKSVSVGEVKRALKKQLKKGLRRRDAIENVAEALKVSERTVYRRLKPQK